VVLSPVCHNWILKWCSYDWSWVTNSDHSADVPRVTEVGSRVLGCDGTKPFPRSWSKTFINEHKGNKNRRPDEGRIEEEWGKGREGERKEWEVEGGVTLASLSFGDGRPVHSLPVRKKQWNRYVISCSFLRGCCNSGRMQYWSYPPS